jgi:hypothetical protein
MPSCQVAVLPSATLSADARTVATIGCPYRVSTPYNSRDVPAVVDVGDDNKGADPLCITCWQQHLCCSMHSHTTNLLPKFSPAHIQGDAPSPAHTLHHGCCKQRCNQQLQQH